MLGAIAGDIIGSVYEFQPIKTTDFPLFGEESRFTDDSVLTVAVADSIITGKSYAAAIKQWGRRYPQAGYGKNFYQWLMSRCSVAYESWGNGSAMRVSPIGWAFDSLEQTLKEARRSAEITHNHPEGIKGAQVIAGSIFMCRQKASKERIREWIEAFAGYELQRKTADIRPNYRFDVSCQGSVPEAIICFMESKSTEEAIRLAVSLGGDADTQACISGALAHAYYGALPDEIKLETTKRLPEDMKEVLKVFSDKYL